MIIKETDTIKQLYVAIVIQAVNDYRKALRLAKKGRVNANFDGTPMVVQNVIDKCEDFFNSSAPYNLSGFDGRKIKEHIQGEMV